MKKKKKTFRKIHLDPVSCHLCCAGRLRNVSLLVFHSVMMNAQNKNQQSAHVGCSETISCLHGQYILL